jgi:hypothetical protein
MQKPMLSDRELATVLAALRLAQQDRAGLESMPHFEDVEPLSNEEIDELCERLNTES